MGDIKILHLLLDILYNIILNTVQDFATIEVPWRQRSKAGLFKSRH